MVKKEEDAELHEQGFVAGARGGRQFISYVFLEDDEKSKPELHLSIPSLDTPRTRRKSMASESPQTSRLLQAPTLPRGAACLPCRRRKMVRRHRRIIHNVDQVTDMSIGGIQRCDGAKPHCAQCSEKGRTADCEYPSDVQGLTKIQMMEENIALLEARIRELEDPTGVDASVRLHHPTPLVASEPHNILSTESLAQSSQSSSYSTFTAATHYPTVPTVAEPTAEEVTALINAFVPHATQMGFFLSIPRFLLVSHTLEASSPMTHPAGPLFDSLLSTVCLWGIQVSPDASLKRHEEYLVSRSVKLLASSIVCSTATAGPQGHAIIGVIQAEVLLANYFFSVGRFLEGRYHCGAAAALCISCRLNALSTPAQSITHLLVPGTPTAEAVPDATTVGERINAFWAVYALDTTWAIALGSPCSLRVSSGSSTQDRTNMTISTPWPMRMEDYERGHQVVFNAEDTPVANLLDGLDVADPATVSPPALRAQAATLFSHASLLASRYGPGMSVADTSTFCHTFAAVDDVITRFTSRLPPIGHVVGSNDDKDALDTLVASTLARVAVIQLHHRFSGSHARSRDVCVSCAQTVVATLQGLEPSVKFLDPIMAVRLAGFPSP
ncbi:hypothetical protein BC835DRAFT_1417074 [Cytidiella melzeri]|nr:hypothetical protein BC835DRAFT_1417074 [Cytidiella melzeri]